MLYPFFLERGDLYEVLPVGEIANQLRGPVPDPCRRGREVLYGPL